MQQDPTIDDVEDANIGDASCTPTFFVDKAELISVRDDIMAMVTKMLPTIDHGELSMSYFRHTMFYGRTQRVRHLLDKYLEQPSLLDPHLEDLLSPVVGFIIDFMVQQSAKERPENLRAWQAHMLHALFQFIYLISKVRGYKTIVKYLTHEAAHLEPAVAYLQSIPNERELWESRYITIMWLSLIVMIPFDLKTIDSGERSGVSLVETLISMGKGFLSSTSIEQDSAAILLVRLISRKDTIQTELPAFLRWSESEITRLRNDSKSQTTAVFLLRGILQALCSLHKIGPRQELIQYVPLTLGICSSLVETQDSKDEWSASNALVRKLVAKLSQRVGLCCLKPKPATWRYQQGSRSLARNLGVVTEEVATVIVDNPSDDFEIPAEVEETIGLLLTCLRDKDTIVRWSAAKGIGRISSRLPQEVANEIIGNVISMFEEDVFENTDSTKNLSAVSDTAWHGACLAIAELSRRGLLMPSRLKEVVPWIQLCLLFDMKRGAHSIGAHVRDAACYVCWSFARVYDPTVLLPHITALSQSLAITSTLDREVNVRRAASAALQEGVGRLGGDGVPNGLQVITIADYFSVGNRVNSILSVSVEVARFDSYRHAIINHVASHLITHWDRSLRVLASKCLGSLTQLDPKYTTEVILPNLIKLTTSADVHERHGSILAVGEICLAWGGEGGFKSFSAWNAGQRLSANAITDLVPNYPAAVLETFGSDITRFALCRLISCLCQAKWPNGGGGTGTSSPLPAWLNLIHTSLERRETTVQEAAAEACSGFAQYCFVDGMPGDASPTEESFINTLVSAIDLSADKFKRRGTALAIGTLPSAITERWVQVLIPKLIMIIETRDQIKPALGEGDAESRQNAVNAILLILKGLGIQRVEKVISPDLFSSIVEAYFYGMEDYSIDTRGDVGSWVREACFRTWPELIRLMYQKEPNGLLQVKHIAQALRGLARQTLERIDRVRETAGLACEEVLSLVNDEVDVGFGHAGTYARLKKSILDRPTKINWMNPSETFATMIPLLSLDALQKDLLLGLVVSVGGISESLTRQATSCFVEFVNKLSTGSELVEGSPPLKVSQFLGDFLSLFKDTPKHIKERVSVSLLEATDVLIGCGALNRALTEDGWVSGGAQLFEAVKAEIGRSKDVKKVLAAVKVFTGLATLESEAAAATRRLAISELVAYLIHPYPRVRKASSESLYIIVSTSTEDSFAPDVEDLILSTDWDKPVAELKPLKAQILAMF